MTKITTTKVYVLGGYQTDFSRNWTREGLALDDMMRDAVDGALVATGLAPDQIQSGHVGNFAAELFLGQGHLGGMLASLHPEWSGLPTGRHEAACASGSIALLAAMAEIESGRYDRVLVTGIECMRNVPGDQAAAYIGGTAAWNGREGQDAKFMWPHMFSELGDEYERRYGLKAEHLLRIAEINLMNAKRNPNAQTRDWTFTEKSFTLDDHANPLIEGRIRRQDCGQITDGAAAVILASESAALDYAKAHNMAISDLPYIRGWGHRTAPFLYAEKIRQSQGQPYIFPQVRAAITDAFQRAGLEGVGDLDGIETHDCFTTTRYMAIDHFGITAPGESWKAIENGDIEMGGRIPVNPSGGLIGLGHPVGATGVRMLLDAAKQVCGNAGAYQLENAKNIATLNVGGSATTIVSFVVSHGSEAR